MNEVCGLSDFHNIVCTATRINVPIMKPRTICYRNYKHLDEEKYVNDVNNIPLSICDVFDDFDDKMWCFQALLQDVIDENVPIKQRTIKKPSVLYMNSKLRKSIHRKSMLYHKYQKGKVSWDTYRKQRNYTTSLNKRSKENYFHKRCNNTE